MTNNKTLNGKDFINIGIFTAIYMVIVIAIACTVGLVPIGFILLPVILPVIGGIPMMLCLCDNDSWFSHQCLGFSGDDRWCFSRRHCWRADRQARDEEAF